MPTGQGYGPGTGRAQQTERIRASGSPGTLDFFDRTDLGFRTTDRFRQISKGVLSRFDELEVDNFKKWRKLSDVRTLDVGEFTNFENVFRVCFVPKSEQEKKLDMYWLEKWLALSPLQFANAIASKYFGFDARYLVPVGFPQKDVPIIWAVVIPQGLDQFNELGTPPHYSLDAYPSATVGAEPAGPISGDYHYRVAYDVSWKDREEEFSK